VASIKLPPSIQENLFVSINNTNDHVIWCLPGSLVPDIVNIFLNVQNTHMRTPTLEQHYQRWNLKVTNFVATQRLTINQSISQLVSQSNKINQSINQYSFNKSCQTQLKTVKTLTMYRVSKYSWEDSVVQNFTQILLLAAMTNDSWGVVLKLEEHEVLTQHSTSAITSEIFRKTKLGCQKNWGWGCPARMGEIGGGVLREGTASLFHTSYSVGSALCSPSKGSGRIPARQIIISYFKSSSWPLLQHVRNCFCECWRFFTLFLAATTLDSWGVVPKLGG